MNTRIESENGRTTVTTGDMKAVFVNTISAASQIGSLQEEVIRLRRHLHRVVRYGATCLPSNTEQWLEEFTERLESADKLLAEPQPTTKETT